MSALLAAGGQVTPTDVWMIIAIILLLVVLIFLSLAEMGLSRMTKPKAAALADQGHKSGRTLTKLVADPERWVNPLLLTVNICQTVQATLTGIVAARLFGTAGVVVGVVLNVIVFFVLAEAVPKTYAVLYPQRAALMSARPISALVGFWPLRVISHGLISLTNVIVKGKGLEQGPFVSEQERLGIVEAAAEEGVVEQEEQKLIESIIEFGDTIAREVMIPRPDMVIVDATQSVTQALDVAMEHGHSRVPVHGADDEDDIVGLAFAKDLMQAERDGRGATPVVELIRPVRFIPENKPVNRLMREMQAEKFHLAIVADEYGAVAGLVTLEDCLEELVGEIVDEHDDEDADVEQLVDGAYLVDGGTAISDVNELLGIELPDDDWDSIGGLVFGTLGRVPELGEAVERDGWKFAVDEMEGRRIRKVRITLSPDTAPPPDEDDD